MEPATEAASRRLGDLRAAGRTPDLDAGRGWNHDAPGRTVACLSIEATGVGIQGGRAARVDGRMV